MQIAFRAKSGKEKKVEVTDARLNRIVRRLSDLPGQHLFQYVDGDERIPVSSDDVNRYIQHIMGDSFAAKDFRTWAASVLAFELLASAQGELSLAALTGGVGEYLGNTPSMAQNSYIHPALISLTKQPQEQWRQSLRLPRQTRHLDRHERSLIAFLRDDRTGSDRRG